jgi:uncharacterized membrane protein
MFSIEQRNGPCSPLLERRRTGFGVGHLTLRRRTHARVVPSHPRHHGMNFQPLLLVRVNRSWVIGGLLVGISLGGLFDGILLHQVLQWHHLLSLVESQSVQDIRTQIMADGLFHVLMYVLACIGLLLLWRSNRSHAQARSSALLGITLLGFSIWQFVDVILFHWIFRIHRIRVDVDNPLVWDVGWMLVFGLPTAAASLWLLSRAGKEPPPHTGIASGALTSVLLISALVSLLPTGKSDFVVAIFAPSITPSGAFKAIAASGAQIIWAHESGSIIALNMGSAAKALPLYASGAILVSATFAPCLGRLRG